MLDKQDTTKPAVKRTPQRTPKECQVGQPNASDPAETALALFAHDIRTPLTGIVALGELLAASDLPARERGWALAIKSAAEHLTQLTTVAIDGVRAGGTGLIVRQDPFRPRQLVETVATSLTARAELKGLSAKLVVSDVPEVVIGDGVRVRAALENLIDNAVKFTECGSITIKLSSEPVGPDRIRLTFEISDTGIGLSQVELDRLFRPFSQANDDIARRFGGSGLGLSFVKRIALALGGGLTVTSEQGRGSVFRLDVLAALTSSVWESDEQRPVADRAVTRSLRILCAEDNPYARVVLNTILTELRHKADFVATGEAAVEAVQWGRYDAVLMDVTLSGLDGIAAARRIRALSGNPSRVPIIGITGHGESGEEALARAAGMSEYLVKPVSPSALADALASFSYSAGEA